MFARVINKIKRNAKRYEKTVTFHMKSGDRIEVLCDNIKITSAGNEIQAYELVNSKVGAAFYVRIDDISAITYVFN